MSPWDGSGWWSGRGQRTPPPETPSSGSGPTFSGHGHGHGHVGPLLSSNVPARPWHRALVLIRPPFAGDSQDIRRGPAFQRHGPPAARPAASLGT